MTIRESQELAERLIPMDLNNKHLRRVAERIVVCAVVLGLCVQQPSITSALQRAGNDIEKPNDVRLVLRSSKKTYSSNEAIELLAYLENVSQDKTYFVGRNLGKFFIIESFHYIELQIKDEKGREALVGRGAATSIWKPGTILADKLAQEYVQLQPRMIYGQKDAGNITLPPGRYRLMAKYHEAEALLWTKEERNSLHAPVWTRPLLSNSVIIRVLPHVK